MLIDKVCGLNELEMTFQNKNQKRKSKTQKENEKSSWNFQSIFEQEIEKERYK